jgi:hypothetical protein
MTRRSVTENSVIQRMNHAWTNVMRNPMPKTTTVIETT